MTAPKTPRKTAASTVKHEEPKVFAAFASYDDLSMTRREIAAAVANVFVGILTGAAIIVVTEMLSAAVFASTASVFLALLVSALGWAIAIVAAMLIGARVAKYIALGKAEDDFYRIRSWVTNKYHGYVHRAPATVH